MLDLAVKWVFLVWLLQSLVLNVWNVAQQALISNSQQMRVIQQLNEKIEKLEKK